MHRSRMIVEKYARESKRFQDLNFIEYKCNCNCTNYSFGQHTIVLVYCRRRNNTTTTLCYHRSCNKFVSLCFHFLFKLLLHPNGTLDYSTICWHMANSNCTVNIVLRKKIDSRAWKIAKDDNFWCECTVCALCIAHWISHACNSCKTTQFVTLMLLPIFFLASSFIFYVCCCRHFIEFKKK